MSTILGDLAIEKLSARFDPAMAALFAVPTAVIWNRVEGRPRSDDLSRAMRAEIRDPVWMLARQWQFGERDGEDAGVPVHAKLSARSWPLTSVHLGRGEAETYDPKRLPLEVLVERTPVEFDLSRGSRSDSAGSEHSSANSIPMIAATRR